MESVSNPTPTLCSISVLQESMQDGVDRINELPDEIIVVILSFLSLREAAATSVVSSRWVDLWKHTPNLKSDRLNLLPHSVIVNILSFLPLKTAAATSVLCSRWPDLWKHTTNLNFTTSIFQIGSYNRRLLGVYGSPPWDADTCKYLKLVNSVIQSHKAPSLKQFAISLYVDKSANCVAAKWLEFAFSRGVERLVLDFNCWDPVNRVVLEELLRESGLCSSPQTRILFRSLKRLSLTHVRLSDGAVKMFLLNCPSLEELIIGHSTMMHDVDVCGAALVLKHFEVYGFLCPRTVRVSAPNLTRLTFNIGIGKLFLGSLPKLVEAEFIFQSLDLVQIVASALFRFSSHLEILNLSIECPKVLMAIEFPEMHELRKLVVEYYGVKTHSLLPVTALLWACPRLQEFKLKFKEILNFRDGERCGHLHLKLFELEGLVNGADGHIELVTYISDNCVGLEKIKISVTRSPPYGTGYRYLNQDAIQAAIDYAGQCLQGKLPQHIQLQLL